MEWNRYHPRAQVRGQTRVMQLYEGEKVRGLLQEDAYPAAERMQSRASGSASCGAVISRVPLMCSVEQVIYRVARDPSSLNVVHELVFQTFSHEL